MRVFPRQCALLFLVMLGPCCLWAQSNFPGTDDKWQYLKSEHFELYSRVRESDSRTLLYNLELLRAMFLDFFKLSERRKLEVTVYVFKSKKDFQTYGSADYGPRHTYAGFYVSSVDRAVIYMIQGENEEATRQLIFHEYVHHLLDATEQVPPPWLNEGLAELFSTIKPEGGKLEFGHPSAGRLWQAQTETLMPLEQLFGIDRQSSVFRQGNHVGRFYAQSWALVHYLYFGDSKIEPERRRRFIGLVLRDAFHDADQMRAGFREVFQMDYPEMLARLDTYLRSGKYFWTKNPLPVVAGESTYVKRAVPEKEIAVRLAELALRSSRSPAAKLRLLQAAEQDPTEIRALEALGSEALRDQDELRAQERWAQAVERGTRNPAIYRELGLMEGRAVFSQFDVYYRMPPEKAERMRSYLLRSIEFNPEQSGAYEMLAWVEAFAHEPSVKNLNLVQNAYPHLTRLERTALALAFVRVRLDRKAEALEMLAALETMQPDEWETHGIEVIRAFVEGRPIRGDGSRRLTTEEAGRVRVRAPKLRPTQTGN